MPSQQKSIPSVYAVAWLAVGVVLLLSRPAMADTIDDVIRDYQTAALSWIPQLKEYATTLFYALFAIEFSWAMASHALRGADLSEFLAEFLKQIFFFGIFLYLVQNSNVIAEDIVNSFIQAAAGVPGGTASVSPSQIFQSGLQIANQLIGQINIGWFGSGTGSAIVAALCAMIIVVVVAYITMVTIMVNVEAYIVIAALTLFTGFGGSRWTKDYALRSVTYAISIGGKLFILNLVASLAEQLLHSDALLVAGQFDIGNVLTLIGTIIVLAGVIKQLPDMVASLLAGAAIGGSMGLFAAAETVKGAAVGAALGGAGVAVAGAAAFASASEQPATGGPADASSRLGRFASMTGRAARTFGEAAMADIGGRLSGTRTSVGRMGFRMAADIGSRGAATSPRPGGPPAPPSPLSPPARDHNTISPSS